MSELARTYLAALRAYLEVPGEATLRAAYELGRETVRHERSLLELSVAHDDALAAILAAETEWEAGRRSARAAGEFYLECISTFEMVQRGVREAHEAARLERRHADMLRGLSDFLSDSSLALAAPDSLAEMGRLVADQAREFIQAECCLVTTAGDAGPGERSASHESEDLAWRAFVRWADLSPVEEAVWAASGAVRFDALEIEGLLPRSLHGPVERVRVLGWLGAPLTALGGHRLGTLHLINRTDGEFSVLDEAIALHLAQMAAAAVERARFYGGRS